MSKDQTTALVQKIASRRLYVPSDSIHVRAENEDGMRLTLQAEGVDYRLEQQSMPENKILRELGITRKFLEACKDDVNLCQNAIDKAISGGRSNRAPILDITTVGDRNIVAIHPTNAVSDTPMSLSDVWNALKDFEEIAGTSGVTDLTRGRFDLRTITRTTMNPRRSVGDITSVGVRVNVFESGIKMNPFAFRLVCTNGLQRATNGDIFHVNMSDPIPSIRSSFTSALEIANSMTQQFVDTDDIQVPDPQAYVLRALSVAGASDGLRARVADLVKDQAPNGTLYELLNIVTSLARQNESPNKRNRMEILAGNILAMQAGGSRCSHCHSRI